MRVPLLVIPRTASRIGAPGGGGSERKKLVRGKDNGKRDGRGVWGGDHDDLIVHNFATYSCFLEQS